MVGTRAGCGTHWVLSASLCEKITHELYPGKIFVEVSSSVAVYNYPSWINNVPRGCVTSEGANFVVLMPPHFKGPCDENLYACLCLDMPELPPSLPPVPPSPPLAPLVGLGLFATCEGAACADSRRMGSSCGPENVIRDFASCVVAAERLGLKYESALDSMDVDTTSNPKGYTYGCYLTRRNEEEWQLRFLSYNETFAEGVGAYGCFKDWSNEWTQTNACICKNQPDPNMELVGM